MALITCPGGAESQSYAPLKWLEDYVRLVYGGLSDSWSNRTDTQKHQCAEFSALFFNWLPLRGRRSYRNQRLSFPRDYQVNPRIVPDEVKRAQALVMYEIAGSIIDAENDAIGSTSTGGGVSSVSLGVLSVSFAGPDQSAGGGGRLMGVIRSGFPLIYTLLSEHLIQVRGRRLRTTEERLLDEYSLLTTSSGWVEPSTTTATPTTTTVELTTTT